MAKSPPRSKLGRMARLGGLSSRVGSSYLGQQVKSVFQSEEVRERALNRLHLKNAERVVETMGALKGAAMKVGQTLAVAVDGIDLPPEVTGILSQLHDSAQPVPFAQIRATVESELSGTLEERFAHFDEEPLGAASLAQAHAARLHDGTEVVVKALYDGIESSVDTDLTALKTMLISSRILRRDPAEVRAIFAEVRERLSEELDYYQEAANIEEFHAAYAGVEGLRIPKTYPSHCTGRVLTMDRLSGTSAEVFARTASPQAKQRAGDTLAETFYDMIYRQRSLHADPHGGNYLFDADGSVGIIDFGCVKRFDTYWVSSYAQLALSFLDHDFERAMPMSIEVGILAERDAGAEAVLKKLAATICEPLMHTQYTCGGPQDNVTAKVARLAPAVLLQGSLRSPSELVFMHRALGGTYTLLRKLGHTADYGGIYRRYAAHAIGVAAGEIEDGSPVA
jgi:predicted unusual protein kinase regulating ubiquinone biosynthesis (AarF/ABC1/UbiB family)